MQVLPASIQRLLLLALAATALSAAVPASASALAVTRQTPTSCDSHVQLTDWKRDLRLPQFSVPGGTLVAVTVSQEVGVTSSYRVESLNGSSRSDTLTLEGAAARVQVPGFEAVEASLPAGQRQYSFTAYDGVTDYAGSSGISGTFGTARDSSVGTAASLDAWRGSGVVLAPASSGASTSNTLSGNFRLEWDTPATVRACVTFTYTEEVLVCIGDYVWYDANRDGIQDAGEAGVAGRPITVSDATGNVLGTTTTSAAGYWKVCQLEPSTPCVVAVDLPDGWSLSPAFVGGNRGIDSDGAAAGADTTISCITPPAGEDLTFDAGINQAELPVEAPAPPPARLRVTKDANRTVMPSRGLVTFTVRVTNRGGLPVRDLRVCDAPPAQLAFTSRPRGATMRNGQLCWNVSRLLPGRTATYRYTMRASNVAARQCVVNRATAVAAVGGSAAARDTVCIRPTRLGVLQLAG